jgi:WD40 repeat protein
LLLDLSTGEVRRTELHDWPPGSRALQFSPDGKTIVSGNLFGTVHWWDRATGKELRRLQGILVAASGDGKWLAIRQEDDILLWDTVADKEARRLPLRDALRPGTSRDPSRDSSTGSFSADGTTLALPDGPRIRILDTRTGKESFAPPGHFDDVVFVGFSPDGRRLITAGDYTVRFWDPHTGKEVGSLRGQRDSIYAASVGADGRLLAAGTRTGIVRLWDLEARRELRQLVLKTPARGYSLPALAPDGKTVAVTGGADGFMQLFEVATGKELWHLAYGSPIALAFLPDGSAVADLIGNIRLFDPQSGKQLLTLVEPNNGYTRGAGMAFSFDSRMVATGYWDRATRKIDLMNTVSLWEISSGKFIAQFRGHKGMVAAFAFAHSGRVVASGGADGTVRLWDLASGRELRTFTGHRGPVLSLAFAPDDTLLASGGSDTGVLVWDVAQLTANCPLSARALSGEALEKRWVELGADSAEVAYRALWQLAAGGKPAVAFLREQLGADPAVELRVKKLIADLDADQFEARARANQELSLLGARAQRLLKKARESAPSAEVRRRVEDLLARLQDPGPGRASEDLRQLRAVQALEYAATPESRRVLQVLADKEPDTPWGRAAATAGKRLATQRR